MLMNLLAFTGAVLVLAVTPGPALAVVLRQTLQAGQHRAFATIAGNATGILVWAGLAAAGLSALLTTSQAAYEALRLVGAAVLVALGIQTLLRARTARRADTGADDGHDQAGLAEARHVEPPAARERLRERSPHLRRAYRLGLMTSLTNPKAAAFAVSFLPQFVPADESGAMAFPLFAVVWAAVASAWYVGVSFMVSRARIIFARPVVRRRLEHATGVLLVGFGLRLALSPGRVRSLLS